ncbi:hypothetical protein EVAR_63197_1 [Eumeta japonica]|uniref:Uncharacterized protein n=1 Tax=Eumeta variegata TaxID=151549 RepID=A0A4C2A0M9_EUMVA|nr:hypothetical protein EVAR_63197_1 [Eumeta japonica]
MRFSVQTHYSRLINHAVHLSIQRSRDNAASALTKKNRSHFFVSGSTNFTCGGRTTAATNKKLENPKVHASPRSLTSKIKNNRVFDNEISKKDLSNSNFAPFPGDQGELSVSTPTSSSTVTAVSGSDGEVVGLRSVQTGETQRWRTSPVRKNYDDHSLPLGVVVVTGLLHPATGAGTGVSLWLVLRHFLARDTAFTGLDKATISLPFGSPAGADRHARLMRKRAVRRP